MSELIPCPFCGGEADISDEGLGTEPERYWVFCANGRCFVEGTPAFTTEAEAIAAWNTRAERTCEITFKRGAMYDVARYSCCGYELATPVSESLPAENYCPNCGAKVVD